MPNLEIETWDWGSELDDFVEIDSATSSSNESWEHVEGADAADADSDADDSNTLTPAEQQGLVDEFPALKGILSEIDGASPEAAMLDELAAGGTHGVGAKDELARQRRVAFLAEAEAAELQAQNAQLQDSLKELEKTSEQPDTAPAMVVISGAKGPHSGNVNATNSRFELVERGIYRKVGEGDDWLFIGDADFWCVGTTKSKNAKTNGWARSMASADGLPPASGAAMWQVSDGKGKWCEPCLLTLRTLSAEEAAAENAAAEAALTKAWGATPSAKSAEAGGIKIQETIQEKLQHLDMHVQGIHSKHPERLFKSTLWIRKLLSIANDPPIAEVIATGVVPRLVELLQLDANPKLQFEAAWALTNIASGTAEQTAVVVDNNAVPIFVRLLSSPDDDVREQAVWALGNIAGDSPSNRDLVLNAGALEPLLAQLTEASRVSMLRNATWTLSNFCRGKPQPQFGIVSPALPTLARLINSTDEEVLIDACWALSCLSDGTNDNIQAVIEAEVVTRLVELLAHPSPTVQTPALRTIGNIVTGDDLQTQLVIQDKQVNQCGDGYIATALPSLLQLLDSPKKSTRKEACWTLSNITAGNQDQIQAVIDAGCIPPLVHLLSVADFGVKKEAAWAISNATSGGTPDQIREIARCGAVKPLCDLLTVKDSRIVNVALEGIENILKQRMTNMMDAGVNSETNMMDAGGMAKLEQLQSHANDEVYQRAVKILEKYFSQEVQPPPSPTIKLTSSDDNFLEVSVEVANQSAKIKEMMEKQSLDIAIPLPGVQSEILAKVVEFCVRQIQTAEWQRVHFDYKLVSPEDEWQRKFLDVDQGTLFRVIMAANYLGIKPLLDLTCKGMIKGKTPDEIRAHFNIVNDFTEEEEEVRRDIFSEPDARTVADDAVAGVGRGSRAAGTQGVLPRLFQREPEDKPVPEVSDALSDKEFEKYYAPLLKTKEMTQAGLLNPASPWTRFANGDRAFYQRTDRDASGERTLEKPAEGYKDDRSDESFDKYYSPLMKKSLEDDFDVYMGRSRKDNASESEINPLALIDDEEDATDSEDDEPDETEPDRAKPDCCCSARRALCPACASSDTPEPQSGKLDPLALIDNMAMASAGADKVMQLMQATGLEYDAALVLLHTHGTVQAATSAALTGLAAKATTVAPAVELVIEFELQEALLKATKDTTKANPQPERFDASHVFQVGERVRVVVGAPELEALAAGHGGWSKRMVDVCGAIGTVVRVSHKCGGEGSAPSVKFDDQRSWRLNPRALGPAGKAKAAKPLAAKPTKAGRRLGRMVTKDVAGKGTAPAMVVISGAKGPDSTINFDVNGRFELAERGVYRKVGAADRWLFIAGDGRWYVGGTEDCFARTAAGFARTAASADGLPPASGEAMWQVSDGKVFCEPCLLQLYTLSAEEAAAENAAAEAALAEAWGATPPAKSPAFGVAFAAAAAPAFGPGSSLAAAPAFGAPAGALVEERAPKAEAWGTTPVVKSAEAGGTKDAAAAKDVRPETTSYAQLPDGEQLFRCVAHRGVALRSRPDFAARDDSVRGPEYGEVVEASTLVTTKGGAKFLQRADGRGWHPMSDDRADDVFFMPLNTLKAPQGGGRKAGGGGSGKKVQFSPEPKCKTKKKTAATAVAETFVAAADLGDRLRLQLGTDDLADRFYVWWWLLPVLVGLLCYMPRSGFYTLCKTAAGAISGYLPSWTFWIGFVMISMAANFFVEECYQGHGSRYQGQAGTPAAKVVKDEVEDCLFVVYLGWWLVFSMFSWQTVAMALIVWALAAPERAAKALEASKDKTAAMLELLGDSTLSDVSDAKVFKGFDQRRARLRSERARTAGA